MAKKDKNLPVEYWDGITDDDFIDGSEIVNEDVGEFNSAAMQIYGANVNYARQIVNVMDSLKPVERRILWAFYQEKALPGKKTKCTILVAQSTKYHNHGDITVYKTMVNMTQNWKTAVPYIDGPSNFGTAISASLFGASRYTEAYLSDYAYECFFEDFSIDAVGTVSFATGLEEPRFLPTKFPNVLVNGSQGVGSWAYSCVIPPYHISDIIHLCKEYMKNPDAEDIILYPDLPTGCYIVENEKEIEKICKTGQGNLRMRARIEIEDHPNEWRLIVTNLPFTTDYENIRDSILDLGKKGIIKIKHVGEDSPRYALGRKTWVDPKLVIKLDKALDPKRVRADLYRLTELEKTLPLRYNVVVGTRDIELYSLKGLVLAWLDQRRIYKRSMYNHTINKLRSDLDMLDILIELTEKDNLEKTVKIIKNTPDKLLVDALMTEYGMNSHQATVVADMKMRAWTSDAHDNYIERRKKTQEKYDELTSIAYNPKKIDKIILDELDDLRKYGPSDRRSPLIRVDNEEVISNSEHLIVFTSQGYIKKVPKFPDKHHTKNPVGVLAPGDKAVSRIYVNNTDSIILVDSYGKYTIMPVYEIPNTIYSSPGETIFSVTKLEGKLKAMLNVSDTSAIVRAFSNEDEPAKMNTNEIHLVTLSEQGMMKATAFDEYLKSTDEGDAKIPKRFNARTMKLRDKDNLAAATFLYSMDSDEMKLLVFTAKGKYVLLSPSEMPVTSTKDAVGLRFITPEAGDKCADIVPVFPNTSEEWIVVLTAKGYAKKVECQYLQESKKRNDASYLTKVDDDDEVIFAQGICSGEKLYVITKNAGEVSYDVDTIPTLSRNAKGKKLVPVPVGDSIINACIDK